MCVCVRVYLFGIVKQILDYTKQTHTHTHTHNVPSVFVEVWMYVPFRPKLKF